MNTVELTCAACTKTFHRRKAEYVRSQVKKGRKPFCSLSCSASAGNVDRDYTGRPEEHRSAEWTPFYRMLQQTAKNGAARRRDFELTPEILRALWERQGGLCAVSGLPLTLRGDKIPLRASVDRIDSSRGYTEDNIQFIALMANYAKHSWSVEDLVSFCEAVAQHN